MKNKINIPKFKENLHVVSQIDSHSTDWVEFEYTPKSFTFHNIPMKGERPKWSEFFTTHWHTASEHSQAYPSDCMMEGSHTRYAYACQFKSLQIFLFEDLLWFWIADNWKKDECWGGEHNRKLQKFHNIRFYDCHNTYLQIYYYLYIKQAYDMLWGTNDITITEIYMNYTLFYLICIVIAFNPFSFPIVQGKGFGSDSIHFHCIWHM